ncbi:MAG TPA: aminotransferase class V-fold PLP-dependent enzyme, partial [Candidatus Aenigmarchaeota archaeon]|nr:aminotransferase class V-fold PLP-dependent enzyme [Candidatus Aenigmarchaeota archaeon]
MNTDKIRKDFPLLEKNIVYLDSACMSLKPRPVVEAMNDYYYNYPSCGERSAHRLGKKVTEEYETARKKVARFVGAKQEEIIFTRN